VRSFVIIKRAIRCSWHTARNYTHTHTHTHIYIYTRLNAVTWSWNHLSFVHSTVFLRSACVKFSAVTRQTKIYSSACVIVVYTIRYVTLLYRHHLSTRLGAWSVYLRPWPHGACRGVTWHETRACRGVVREPSVQCRDRLWRRLTADDRTKQWHKNETSSRRRERLREAARLFVLFDHWWGLVRPVVTRSPQTAGLQSSDDRSINSFINRWHLVHRDIPTVTEYISMPGVLLSTSTCAGTS